MCTRLGIYVFRMISILFVIDLYLVIATEENYFTFFPELRFVVGTTSLNICG